MKIVSIKMHTCNLIWALLCNRIHQAVAVGLCFVTGQVAVRKMLQCEKLQEKSNKKPVMWKTYSNNLR